IEQARVRGRLLAPMLNAALAVPVAQHDYATVRNILRESRTEDGLSYLVLLNEDGKTIADEGWDLNTPLPALEDNASTADFKSDGRFDTQVPLVLAGQRYGLLRYAISTTFLDAARAGLLRGSLMIAAAAIVISIVLQFALGLWLTRHLRRLTAAGEAMAAGDLSARVAVDS